MKRPGTAYVHAYAPLYHVYHDEAIAYCECPICGREFFAHMTREEYDEIPDYNEPIKCAGCEKQ